MGTAEEPNRGDRSEIGCRPFDEGASSGPGSADWSIHRATEADLAKVTRFRSIAIMMAGDPDIDPDACADTRVVRDECDACPTWIAQDGERIIGAISLVRSGSLLARVAGLWVDLPMRDSQLPADLLGYALRFCRDAGILKVVLSTYLPGDEAWRVFQRCGFNIARDRQREGRNVRDFYVDLYRQPECERPET